MENSGVNGKVPVDDYLAAPANRRKPVQKFVFMSLRSGTIMKKSKGPLDKQTPKNPKYEHIQSTLDTGFTAKKQLDMRDEDAEHPTPGELFKRIRAGTLTRYIFEEDEIFDPSLGASSTFNEVIYDKKPPPEATPQSIRDARQRQLSGSAASALISSQYVDSETSSPPPTSSKGPGYSSATSVALPASTDSPFLLLDVRTDDLYNQCHIKYGLFFFYRIL